MNLTERLAIIRAQRDEALARAADLQAAIEALEMKIAVDAPLHLLGGREALAWAEGYNAARAALAAAVGPSPETREATREHGQTAVQPSKTASNTVRAT